MKSLNLFFTLIFIYFFLIEANWLILLFYWISLHIFHFRVLHKLKCLCIITKELEHKIFDLRFKELKKSYFIILFWIISIWKLILNKFSNWEVVARLIFKKMFISFDKTWFLLNIALNFRSYNFSWFFDLGNFGSKNELQKVLDEVTKMDQSFTIEGFTNYCRFVVIPNVLEVGLDDFGVFFLIEFLVIILFNPIIWIYFICFLGYFTKRCEDFKRLVSRRGMFMIVLIIYFFYIIYLLVVQYFFPTYTSNEWIQKYFPITCFGHW